VQRFDGEICGFGTAAGVRVVIGRWTSSPLGAFTDAMVEQPDGRRWLIAPTAVVADFVGGVYDFDEIRISEVVTSRSAGRLLFAGAPLRADVTIGARDPLGWALRCVPRRVATSVTWARLLDPVVRRMMRGVRTSGRTIAARETYGATDRRRVLAVEAWWAGNDLGAMADVDPPVRFGFGSTPVRPSLVAVSTTIRPRSD
jgi:hypothetical protein